jgi:glutamyl-tRNA reductase
MSALSKKDTQKIDIFFCSSSSPHIIIETFLARKSELKHQERRRARAARAEALIVEHANPYKVYESFCKFVYKDLRASPARLFI